MNEINNEDLVLLVQVRNFQKVPIFLKQGNKHITINIKDFNFHQLYDNRQQ